MCVCWGGGWSELEVGGYVCVVHVLSSEVNVRGEMCVCGVGGGGGNIDCFICVIYVRV